MKNIFNIFIHKRKYLDVLSQFTMALPEDNEGAVQQVKHTTGETLSLKTTNAILFFILNVSNPSYYYKSTENNWTQKYGCFKNIN